MRIAGKQFVLADEQAVAELKERIVDAVRRGGDFVSIGGQSEVTVLITSHTSVLIEDLDEDEQDSYVGEFLTADAAPSDLFLQYEEFAVEKVNA
jgi:hypothetical protein